MNEVTLKSGSILKVQLAPFSVGMKLKTVLANELKQVEIPPELKVMSLANIAEMDVNLLKDLVFQLLGSTSLEAVIWECMGRTLYNDIKLTKEMFEAEEMRAEYLPIAWEVVKANALPFFKNLPFELKTQPEKKGNSQK